MFNPFSFHKTGRSMQSLWLSGSHICNVDLTVERGLKLCQAIESAVNRRHSQNERGMKSQATVHRMLSDNVQRKFPSCYHCKGHRQRMIANLLQSSTTTVVRGDILERPADPRRQLLTHKGQIGKSRGFGKERRTHMLRGEGESDTEESSTRTI